MSGYKNENTLILELCKFLNYDKEKISLLLKAKPNMTYVLGVLMLNRVGGIANKVLKDSGCVCMVSREFRMSLEACSEMNRQKTRSLKTALGMVAEIFTDAEFDYALLKGALLAYLYQEGCRTSNDLDFLVNQNDLDKISGIFAENGFVQGYINNDEIISANRRDILSARMNRGETVPFIKNIRLSGMKFLEADINFSLDFKARQESDTVEKILGNVKPLIHTEHGSLMTLSEEDFLIHLCAHLYKEAAIYYWVAIGRDLSLYKFCDIYLWINKFFDKEFTAGFIMKAREYKMERECYYTLFNTRLLFEMQNKYLDMVIAEIRPEDISFMNEIYDPETKSIFRYETDFRDWMFCRDRMGALKQ